MLRLHARSVRAVRAAADSGAAASRHATCAQPCAGDARRATRAERGALRGRREPLHADSRRTRAARTPGCSTSRRRSPSTPRRIRPTRLRCAAKAGRASWRAAWPGTTWPRRWDRRSTRTTCCASACTRCRWRRSGGCSTHPRTVDRGGGLPVHRALRQRARPDARAPIKGKLTGHLPRSGELTPDALRQCFGLPNRASLQIPGTRRASWSARPPRLCEACPHGDAYVAIKEASPIVGDDVRVMGDIGCYALGYLEPYAAIHSCLCMGAVDRHGDRRGARRHDALAVRDRRRHVHAFRHGAAARRRAREHRHQGVHSRQQHRRDDRRAADDGHGRAGRGPGRRARRAARAHPRRLAGAAEEGRERRASFASEIAYRGLSVIIARRACVTYAKTIKEH